jgi:hypothetical protein
MTSSINFTIAQIAHFSIGANFVLFPLLVFPHNLHALIYSISTILGVDIVKEMTYDLKYEPGETVISGLVDWSFYIAGIVSTLFLITIFNYI